MKNNLSVNYKNHILCIFQTGDRLDTDVEFGNKAGFHTTLVLTGNFILY